MAQNGSSGLISAINDLGLSFHVLIDVLYFIEALRQQSKFLAEVEPPLFIENIVKAL